MIAGFEFPTSGKICWTGKKSTPAAQPAQYVDGVSELRHLPAPEYF
jgi:ABC-type thiamine transport system ATPase subunit